MNSSFTSLESELHGAALHVPSYYRWWWAQSEPPSYGRHVEVLRLVGVTAAQVRERFAAYIERHSLG